MAEKEFDFEAEREKHRVEGKMFDIKLTTHVPSKYRIVDLETGDIWMHDVELGRWVQKRDIIFALKIAG